MAIDSGEAFHEEVGYWLWDAERRQVMRCFIVPRGVVVNAGGTSDSAAKEFSMAAEAGSEVYGILSNPFLEEAMKTVRYELTVTIHEPWKFSYKEDTQLQITSRLMCSITRITIPSNACSLRTTEQKTFTAFFGSSCWD